MVIATLLGQHYNVGGKPTVILYTCINLLIAIQGHHQKYNIQHGSNNIIMFHIGCKDKTSTWHLNGLFPDGSNLGSTVVV